MTRRTLILDIQKKKDELISDPSMMAHKSHQYLLFFSNV